MEAATGVVRDGGFTIDLTHHAMHVLGSRVFGFNQELYDDPGVPDPAAAASFAAQLAGAYPNVAASPRQRATRMGSVAATTTTSSRSGST